MLHLPTQTPRCFCSTCFEFSNQKFKLDVNELNTRWADPDMIDSWSQMVIKHTDDNVDIITQAPESGIYKMLEDGRVVF